MNPPEASTVALDRSGPVWRGSCAGLGSVAVGAAGEVFIEVEGPDPRGEKARALEFGWGDLLSHARRGFAMALGAVVVPANSPDAALLVCGDAPDVAAVVIALSRHGWLLVSDRPTPTRWTDGSLIAHPRSAPLIIAAARAAAAGLDGVPVRAPSNAVRVDLPRWSDEVPISRVVQVTRRRPNEDAFAELTGHRKFERAASILLGGALTPDGTPQEPAVGEHLRLAELPSAVLRIGTEHDASVGQLLEWWAA